jgi:ADP-heptose:LPS heptosyltransferase
MSFDFSKCKPKNIWFEHKHLPEDRLKALNSLLTNQGYKFMSKDEETTRMILSKEVETQEELPKKQRYIQPVKTQSKPVVQPQTQREPEPEPEPEPEYVVFIINGGIGKNINATVAIRGIKKKYPDKKLVILTGWPDIFKYNPHVHRVFRHGTTPYFYDEYILGNKAIVLNTEPYYHQDYISKTGKHITQSWCEQLNVPFDSPRPELYFSKAEVEGANRFKSLSNKPLFFIQNMGGNKNFKQFIRNLPLNTVSQVVNQMKHTHRIVLIKTKDQDGIEGVENTDNYSLRDSLSLLLVADKVLCIDSMVQHACAAMNKKAVVCWSGTSPELLGYNSNINLRIQACPDPECHRPNSFLADLDTKLEVWSCPYGEPCTNHDVKSILEALK